MGNRAPAFGVAPVVDGLANSDERDGLGEPNERGDWRKAVPFLVGLPGALTTGDFVPRADSCCAVIPMYLLALLPAVILLIADVVGV